MMDRQAHLKKLRSDAAECAALSRFAFDEKKRELFADLAAHLTLLADEVERMTSHHGMAVSEQGTGQGQSKS